MAIVNEALFIMVSKGMVSITFTRNTYVRTYVRMCVRACVRECVRACVRAWCSDDADFHSATAKAGLEAGTLN